MISPMLRPIMGVLASKQATTLVYLLRDEFTTNEAAPITSPRTCEPGPGTLTVYQLNGGSWKITSGVLSVNSVPSPTGYGRLSLLGSQVARAAGVALIGHQTLANYIENLGWSTNQSTGWVSMIQGGRDYAYAPGNTAVAPIPSAIPGPVIWFLILRAEGGGFCVYVKNGAARLAYADQLNTTASPRPAIISYDSTTLGYEYVRVCQLGSPWDSDFGIATSRSETPAANDTIISEAEAHGWLTWGSDSIKWTQIGNRLRTFVSNAGRNLYASATLNNNATTFKVLSHSANLLEIATRWTNDNDCWIIRCDKTSSTIKLIEKNAGVETERGSAAQAWAGGALSNFVSFPYTLSGAALAELEKWTS